ncbi:Hypothetical predicted protein, partial [Pelobates cultripes]
PLLLALLPNRSPSAAQGDSRDRSRATLPQTLRVHALRTSKGTLTQFPEEIAGEFRTYYKRLYNIATGTRDLQTRYTFTGRSQHFRNSDKYGGSPSGN